MPVSVPAQKVELRAGIHPTISTSSEKTFWAVDVITVIAIRDAHAQRSSSEAVETWSRWSFLKLWSPGRRY